MCNINNNDICKIFLKKLGNFYIKIINVKKDTNKKRDSWRLENIIVVLYLCIDDDWLIAE